MSKARSPREVCSTTIGTRGLMARDSIEAGRRTCERAGLVVAGRPELCLFLLALLLLGSPDLLPRLGLLEGNRLRRLGDDVDRLAHDDVLAHHRVAPVLAQAAEELLGCRALVFGGVGERLEHLLLARLQSLRLDNRRQDGLTLQLALGIRL